MSTLTPHGACLLWKPELIWLNAVSDAMLAGAFFATAFVLGFFVWRRRREGLRVASSDRDHLSLQPHSQLNPSRRSDWPDRQTLRSRQPQES